VSHVEREALIKSITERVMSPDVEDFLGEDQRRHQFLDMLPTLQTKYLESLDNVSRFYWATTKSRLRSFLSLMPPTEETKIVWSTVQSIGAYSDWLLAHEEYPYEKFTHIFVQLRDRYGMPVDEHGKSRSIMTHLEIHKDYLGKYHGEYLYLRNDEVVNFVETYYEHVDALRSYCADRSYTGLSDEGFKEYLSQHEALQEGWL